MRPKTLSREEELDLERSFHDIYRTKTVKSHAQMWYQAVLQFLNWKFEGASIITTNVREAEIKIMQNDLHSKEYVSALMKLVLPDDNEARFYSEHQKMMLLLTADNDAREQAIHYIQS